MKSYALHLGYDPPPVREWETKTLCGFPAVSSPWPEPTISRDADGDLYIKPWLCKLCRRAGREAREIAGRVAPGRNLYYKTQHGNREIV